MRNSRLRRLCITLGIVLGLAFSVLILSIIGHAGHVETSITVHDNGRNITLLGDGDCLIVNTYGTGSATYRLTIATLDVYIRNPRPSIELEKTYNTIIATGNRVVELLENADLRVSSKSITIQPYYTYPRRLLGYFITYHITAITTNISTIQNIIPYLVNNMIILELKFTANRSAILRAYRIALDEAIQNAIEKLYIIARALNMTRIVIINIREGTIPSMRPFYTISNVKEQPIIYTPSGKVTATVYVTARLCR